LLLVDTDVHLWGTSKISTEDRYPDSHPIGVAVKGIGGYYIERQCTGRSERWPNVSLMDGAVLANDTDWSK
jgi:hypothetical protein